MVLVIATAAGFARLISMGKKVAETVCDVIKSGFDY
jgi:hypothetical protein